MVVEERLLLVPEIKEAPGGDTTGEKGLVANKQDVVLEGKDIQGMDKFRIPIQCPLNGMTLVTGLEKVAEEDVTQDGLSVLGRQNGIDEEAFTSDRKFSKSGKRSFKSQTWNNEARGFASLG